MKKLSKRENLAHQMTVKVFASLMPGWKGTRMKYFFLGLPDVTIEAEPILRIIKKSVEKALKDL